MTYIFFFGLAIILIIPYAILNTIISMLIAMIEKLINKPGLLFYVGRILRAYIYSSLFLTFSSFYISSGLSSFLILFISYFAVMFSWMIETKTAKENYHNNIEFKLATDRYKIICYVYTSLFFLLYFLDIPKEPWISAYIFKATIWLTKYKIFTIFVIVGGFGIMITCGIKIVAFLKNIKFT